MKLTCYHRKHDGKWLGIIDVGKNNFGKRIRVIKYGNSKAEVEALAESTMNEINNNHHAPKTQL
jgi:hypothetical protein